MLNDIVIYPHEKPFSLGTKCANLPINRERFIEAHGIIREPHYKSFNESDWIKRGEWYMNGEVSWANYFTNRTAEEKHDGFESYSNYPVIRTDRDCDIVGEDRRLYRRVLKPLFLLNNFQRILQQIGLHFKH